MATDSRSLFDVAMKARATGVPNVRLAVPFFNVKDIEASLHFYVKGLGFTITRQWIPMAQSVGAGSSSAAPPSCSRSIGRMGDRAGGPKATVYADSV